MHRTMTTALIVLSILIGSTIGMLALRVVAFPQSTAEIRPADPAIGYAFYEGLNTILAGGSSATLDRVISTEFVDHDAATGVDRTGSELIADVTQAARSVPGMQVVARNIESTPGTLIVSTQPVAPVGMSTARLPISFAAIPGGYDVLRVEAGRITARWSSKLPDLSAKTFEDAGFTFGATSNASASLDRIELPPGASMQLHPIGPSVVIGESGRTRLRVFETDSGGEPRHSTVFIEAGQIFRLSGSGPIDLESDGQITARVLRFSIRPVLPTQPPGPTLAGGASSEIRWSSSLRSLRTGKWQMSIGAQHLPAGTDVTLTLSENGLVLFWSDDAPVQADTTGANISTLGPLNWLASVGVNASFEADHVASVESGTSMALRGESNTVVWLISLQPTIAPPATPTTR